MLFLHQDTPRASLCIPGSHLHCGRLQGSGLLQAFVELLIEHLALHLPSHKIYGRDSCTHSFHVSFHWTRVTLKPSLKDTYALKIISSIFSSSFTCTSMLFGDILRKRTKMIAFSVLSLKTNRGSYTPSVSEAWLYYSLILFWVQPGANSRENTAQHFQGSACSSAFQEVAKSLVWITVL